MTAVIVYWCVGSFLVAPIVGRAMRARPVPKVPQVATSSAA